MYIVKSYEILHQNDTLTWFTYKYQTFYLTNFLLHKFIEVAVGID
jgi:hypothetical protein